MSLIELQDLDLSDPEIHRSGRADELWPVLCRAAPVYWNRWPDGSGFWAVTGYREAVEVYKQPEKFSSARGMMLGNERTRAMISASAASDKMLIVTDPPRHAQMRRIVNAAFTPAAVERLMPQMTAVVSDVLDIATGKPTAEFVSEVAAKLPVAVICQLLGVPKEDQALMVDLTSRAFGGYDTARGEAERAGAHAEIFAYFQELVTHRRNHPSDGDIVTRLVNGAIDGRPVSDEEAVLNCHGFITGGNETTRHASTFAALVFAESPDVFARLRSDAGVVGRAVEEVLRWSSPGMHVLRTARADCIVGNQAVKEGDVVTIWNPAVNRDELVFSQANRFILDRDPNRHLTFGVGEHFCIGAALARMEVRVLLEALRDRVAAVELVGRPVRLSSNFLRGFTELPLRLHAA